MSLLDARSPRKKLGQDILIYGIALGCFSLLIFALYQMSFEKKQDTALLNSFQFQIPAKIPEVVLTPTPTPTSIPIENTTTEKWEVSETLPAKPGSPQYHDDPHPQQNLKKATSNTTSQQTSKESTLKLASGPLPQTKNTTSAVVQSTLPKNESEKAITTTPQTRLVSLGDANNLAKQEAIPANAATPAQVEMQSQSASVVKVKAAKNNYEASAKTTEPKSRTHVVVRGEYLWAIAEKYKVSPKTLVRLNQLKNPQRLEIGQVLRLP